MSAATIIFAVLAMVFLLLGISARRWAEAEESRADKAEAELEKLRKARGDARPTHRFAVPPMVEEWTAADCEIWRSFLANPTGRKLVAICGQHALQQAMGECQGDKGAPVAAGMDAMLRYQFNFASDRMHKELSEAAADSAANQHATAGEQDDAAAVEQRSF